MKNGMSWLTFLDHAIADPESVIDTDEHEEAIELSRGWPTCACGELCKSLPRDNAGEPKDIVLFGLGIRFYGQIQRGEFLDAKDTMKAIDERTVFLMEEMAK